LQNVQTYIQSGNVLFESEEKSGKLHQMLELGIKDKFGFPVAVILRTSTELEQIMELSPYNFNSLAESESIHLSLLAELPSQERVEDIHNFQSGVDQCQIKGKEVYLYLRQSIRDSKLTVRLSKIGVPSTSRNWKTIMKLSAMAKAMD